METPSSSSRSNSPSNSPSISRRNSTDLPRIDASEDPYNTPRSGIKPESPGGDPLILSLVPIGPPTSSSIVSRMTEDELQQYDESALKYLEAFDETRAEQLALLEGRENFAKNQQRKADVMPDLVTTCTAALLHSLKFVIPHFVGNSAAYFGSNTAATILYGLGFALTNSCLVEPADHHMSKYFPLAGNVHEALLIEYWTALTLVLEAKQRRDTAAMYKWKGVATEKLKAITSLWTFRPNLACASDPMTKTILAHLVTRVHWAAYGLGGLGMSEALMRLVRKKFADQPPSDVNLFLIHTALSVACTFVSGGVGTHIKQFILLRYHGSRAFDIGTSSSEYHKKRQDLVKEKLDICRNDLKRLNELNDYEIEKKKAVETYDDDESNSARALTEISRRITELEGKIDDLETLHDRLDGPWGQGLTACLQTAGDLWQPMLQEGPKGAAGGHMAASFVSALALVTTAFVGLNLIAATALQPGANNTTMAANGTEYVLPESAEYGLPFLLSGFLTGSMITIHTFATCVFQRVGGFVWGTVTRPKADSSADKIRSKVPAQIPTPEKQESNLPIQNTLAPEDKDPNYVAQESLLTDTVQPPRPKEQGPDDDKKERLLPDNEYEE